MGCEAVSLTPTRLLEHAVRGPRRSRGRRNERLWCRASWKRYLLTLVDF